MQSSAAMRGPAAGKATRAAPEARRNSAEERSDKAEDRSGKAEDRSDKAEELGSKAEERAGKTEAVALRALAHPLRWKLIDLIGSESSATATRCAEALGESVASCAYHLSILAKYGYIELVPDVPGREKPWRLTSYRQDLSADGLGIEGELASQAATEAFLDHEFARTKERLRRRGLEAAQWRDAGRLLGTSIWVTVDEFRELSEELTALALRYTGRWDDRTLRPAGARLARVFMSTSVAPEPAGGTSAEPAGGGASAAPARSGASAEPAGSEASEQPPSGGTRRQAPRGGSAD